MLTLLLIPGNGLEELYFFFMPNVLEVWRREYLKPETSVICVIHFQSLVANEDFQHILRVLNTNVDGKQKIMFALTSIKGIGRRFANLICKKADVDMNKRYGNQKSSHSDQALQCFLC